MDKIKHDEKGISGQDKNKISEDEIDRELKDTFPASDPPSWTLGLDPNKVTNKSKSKRAK